MPPRKPPTVAPLSIVKVNLLPIAKRLARMEAIILEMRFEQDKRLTKLERKVDRITERLDELPKARLPKPQSLRRPPAESS